MDRRLSRLFRRFAPMTATVQTVTLPCAGVILPAKQAAARYVPVEASACALLAAPLYLYRGDCTALLGSENAWLCSGEKRYRVLEARPVWHMRRMAYVEAVLEPEVMTDAQQ